MKERISETKDHLNEIRCEDKIREKKNEKEQRLQEIQNYVKRPNLHLTGVPESGREMEPSWQTHLGYYLEKLPQPRRFKYSNAGNTENTTKIFHEMINTKTHNHLILQG